MTSLRIHDDAAPEAPLRTILAHDAIRAELAAVNVLFDHVEVAEVLPADAEAGTVLAAHAALVDRLTHTHGYRSADVVRMARNAPDAAAARTRFLFEHTHAEDEARLFVEGSGTFYLHLGQQVLVLACAAGDLLSVPAGVRHWFDMGADPHFTAIRFFTNPDGWVALPTGDAVADRFAAPGH